MHLRGYKITSKGRLGQSRKSALATYFAGGSYEHLLVRIDHEVLQLRKPVFPEKRNKDLGGRSLLTTSVLGIWTTDGNRGF